MSTGLYSVASSKIELSSHVTYFLQFSSSDLQDTIRRLKLSRDLQKFPVVVEMIT